MIEHVSIPLEGPAESTLNQYGQYAAVRVENAEAEKIFFQVPGRICHLDSHWIPPVTADIASVFDRSINPYFSHGEATRWIIVNKNHQACGRIAAFIDFNKQFEGDKRIGGIGFFECIDDDEAAHLLFTVAINWLTDSYQVDMVDGPVNFGENDKHWGLLIKGSGPVSFGMNYNPPYYLKLFESFGFKILYKQLTNYVSLSKPVPERFVKIAQRVISSGRYKFLPLRYNKRERFIRDFVEVYNRAWASFKNFHPMDERVVAKSLLDMRPIMVEDFIWFAYSGATPIGVLVAIPDANEIIRHVGSKFDLWGKCKFLFYKHLKGFTTVRVVIMGVVPEFQNHGIESALILHAFAKARKRPRFKHIQLAWVGDFNEKMIAIHKAMNGEEHMQHATLRKIL